MHIGQTIKLCREATFGSQVAAASALGISVVHLCQVEHDKHQPSLKLLERMRHLFNADPVILEWLLNPPDVDRTPALAKFRKSYFHQHGIKQQEP